MRPVESYSANTLERISSFGRNQSLAIGRPQDKTQVLGKEDAGYQIYVLKQSVFSYINKI